MEILSESTRRKDLITKLNLYMCAGVLEYWIVNPKNKEITIYLFEDKNIKDHRTYTAGMTCSSYLFEGLKVVLEDIFM